MTLSSKGVEKTNPLLEILTDDVTNLASNPPPPKCSSPRNRQQLRGRAEVDLVRSRSRWLVGDLRSRSQAGDLEAASTPSRTPS